MTMRKTLTVAAILITPVALSGCLKSDKQCYHELMGKADKYTDSMDASYTKLSIIGAKVDFINDMYLNNFEGACDYRFTGRGFTRS